MDQNVVTSFIYDYKRTNTYEAYIKANVSDKIVVDCGAGSGILTYLSAINGATKVYCLESNDTIYNNLVTTFSSYSNVEVKKLDCFSETLPTGDIYLHEFFGATLWDEGFLNFVNNLKSQSITNIFPEDITIFSKDSLDYGYEGQRLPYNYNNLSSYIKSFLPRQDWYPIVEERYIYNYSYINVGNKATAYSGNILSLSSSHNPHTLWEVNTSYGTFGNLNTEFSCWPIGAS